MQQGLSGSQGAKDTICLYPVAKLKNVNAGPVEWGLLPSLKREEDAVACFIPTEKSAQKKVQSSLKIVCAPLRRRIKLEIESVREIEGGPLERIEGDVHAEVEPFDRLARLNSGGGIAARVCSPDLSAEEGHELVPASFGRDDREIRALIIGISDHKVLGGLYRSQWVIQSGEDGAELERAFILGLFEISIRGVAETTDNPKIGGVGGIPIDVLVLHLSAYDNAV